MKFLQKWRELGSTIPEDGAKQKGIAYVLLISLFPLVHGTLDCFSCIDIHAIDNCHQITICNTTTEQCYTDVKGVRGNLTYELGCREPDQCLKAQRDVSNDTSVVDCHECCSVAGCNKALCTAAVTNPASHCNISCADDPAFDCHKLDEVFGICHDIHHAKNVCRKFCGLCCLVDGAWVNWSSWGDCSVTCNNGTQTRTRTCTDPPPQNGGLFCEGVSVDKKMCTKEKCPIHGQWSAWGNWTACTASCGVGVTKRHRKCDSPAPSRFGNHCFGDSVDFNVCNIQTCSTDGGWTLWSDWDKCSETCGTGMTIRHRNCSNPLPTRGGSYCFGDANEYKLCDTDTLCAPSGRIYTEWTAWYPCTDNIQFRNRTCFLYGDVISKVACTNGTNIIFRRCHT